VGRTAELGWAKFSPFQLSEDFPIIKPAQTFKLQN
jgi:hypothetical protein